MEMNIDEYNVLTKENLLNPCVAHQGVDLDKDHIVCEETDPVDLTFPDYESESEPSLPSNPPSQEISCSLALEPLSITVHPYHMPLDFEPPCDILEPWEPTVCAEIDHLCLVPHLFREEHFTEPPWHMKERERGKLLNFLMLQTLFVLTLQGPHMRRSLSVHHLGGYMTVHHLGGHMVVPFHHPGGHISWTTSY